MKVKKALKQLAESEKREALYQDRAYSESIRPVKRKKATNTGWIFGLCAVILLIVVGGVFGGISLIGGNKKSASMMDAANSRPYYDVAQEAAGNSKSDDMEVFTEITIICDLQKAIGIIEESVYYGESVDPLDEGYLVTITEENAQGIMELLTSIGEIKENGKDFAFPVGSYYLTLKSE